MRTMTRYLLLGVAAFSGCATVPPSRELADARTEYGKATQGDASRYNPALVQRAREALDRAEAAFADDPQAPRTKDLVYVALRKAELANVQGRIGYDEARLKQAQNDLQATTSDALASARTQLSEAERKAREDKLRSDYEAQNAKTTAQLESERQARLTAEQQANEARSAAEAAAAREKEAADKLEALGKVKQDSRGVVLTLSGSLLFASNKATLLPGAQLKLNEVADALKTTQGRITVEGHTDSVGSEGYNQELSTRRAAAVKDYLASRGIDAARIDSVGMGKTQPIADNSTAEGRANNRRVEIVMQKTDQGNQGTGGAGQPTP